MRGSTSQGGGRAFGFDHINRNAPVLIRTPKLTRFEPAQYWGGGPPGNSVVLNPIFFPPLLLLLLLDHKCEDWSGKEARALSHPLDCKRLQWARTSKK